MKPIPLLLPLLLPLLSFGADAHAVLPASGPAPVGPYSPGVVVGEYLYVSGQGAHSPDGSMPDTFAEQVRQTLENVKAVLEAGGLTMEHIVYTQVYLDDVQKFDQMNGVYAQYFLKGPPARATLGVAKLPGTPVEINAVAVRDLATKKPVLVAGYPPREPVSPGMLTHDRLFVSAMRGRDLHTGVVPSDAAAQVDAALDGVKAVLEAAGLNLSHMVFVNPYLTKQIPMRVMNKLYANRFEFGNTPARATIDQKSTCLNSSHLVSSYAVFCSKKKKKRSPVNPALHPNVRGRQKAVPPNAISCCRIGRPFFNDTATTEIYPLSLHDAPPI